MPCLVASAEVYENLIKKDRQTDKHTEDGRQANFRNDHGTYDELN